MSGSFAREVSAWIAKSGSLLSEVDLSGSAAPVETMAKLHDGLA